jgi:DNA-binding transcriptional MerR regulator
MKELLKDAGYTDEQIKQIEEAYKTKSSKEIADKFIPKDRFDEKNEAAKQLQTEIEKRDKQLEELTKSAKGNEELTQKLKDLEEANTKTREDFDTQLKETKLNNALKFALNGKVKDFDLVAGLLDKSKIELDADGNIKMGFQEQFDDLKSKKDFLFEPENNDDGKKPDVKGAKPIDGDTPPTKAVLRTEFDALMAKDYNALAPSEKQRLNELPELLKKEESTK